MTKDISTQQRLLNLAGLGPLAVDGISGPKTKSALEKWNAEQAKIISEFGELDTRSERNVKTLLPEFQRVIRKWMTERAIPAAKTISLTVKIICGTRDFAEQSRLYAQGRTTPGARVTNAKAGSSFHNYGVAVDIGLFDKQGRYITTDSHYNGFFGRAGIPAGCVWGGNFKSFKDTPHLEWHGVGETSKQLWANSES
jgi:peptidoglycan L-alanyl-D-glutamate endopeptidase CwlK